MKLQRFDPTRYLVAPDVTLDEARVQAFEAMWQAIDARSTATPIEYACAWRKFEFLTYLVREKGVLLHGSNDPGIARFEPRPQTDFCGRARQAVFATDDGIWPIYFAIVDRARVRVLRNACFQVLDTQGVTRTHYLFAVPAAQLRRCPWCEGTVYLLPHETFVQDQVTDAQGHIWKEWTSDEPVHPLGKLLVGPQDFPFLDQVQGFRLMDILRPVAVVVWRQLWHQAGSWFSHRRGAKEKSRSGR